ncbi:MAG: penicillin-binding protein [Solirubrobacteraceae bacterium]|nr:penicillin-binding protein [Solirubrobacteraceae bacterium]
MSDANGSDNVTPLFDEPPRRRPRVRKLRLLVVLVPLALLAIVSTVFGMMMAVASDLPALENRKEYQDARNSVLYDDTGKTALGVLTDNQSRVLVTYDQIAPDMRNAIIAIEDRRFYQNSGVDLRGIARAFVQDVVQKKAAQGGSTITQQFVKNATRAQNQRTIFQKLREAALAYHLTRKWSKAKILTQYLNSIYFGNGAYGIESAARTYFGRDHPGCGTREKPCVSVLRPEEAALLAGVVANPSGYDPVAHPVAARHRRDLVLQRMFQQGLLGRLQYFNARQESLPGPPDPPTVRTAAPYFTTWVRQQLVDRFGARKSFEGGLKITTTLDADLQRAAEGTVKKYFSNPTGPTAALVALDNDTGEVRAMVGGRDYNTRPFNLATQGQRQPGSAIKPFILAEALRRGISPASVWPSRKRVFNVPGGSDKFVVNNFQNSYSGTNTLAGALTASDNSIFAAVGLQVGTKRIARLARQMGIRTPVSSNPAMTLGGLRQGVTPLDMAHAYETFAADGLRVTGTLGSTRAGPVGIRSVSTLPAAGRPTRTLAANKPRRRRVLAKATAQTAVGIMETVVQRGTGKRAGLADGTFAAGKTGTTENSGDAWFVGFTDRLTVAVWVGYPDKLKPMLTEFAGKPVEGGTFPALIWHDFMTGANKIIDDRVARERVRKGLPPLPPKTTTTAPTPPPALAPPAPAEGGDVPAPPSQPTTPPAGGTAAPQATPTTPAPTPAPTPTPTPAPAPTAPPTTAPPAGGGGTPPAAGGGVAPPTG